MAIKMDFSSSRNALQRLSQFLQYDALQKRASARQMEEYRLTDALARGRQTEGFQQDIAKEEYVQRNRMQLEDRGSENAMMEADNEALNKIAQMPSTDGFFARMNMWRKNGIRTEDMPAYEASMDVLHSQQKAISSSMARLAMGLGNEQELAADLQNTLQFANTEFMKFAAGEYGTNRRFNIQAPIDKKNAETSGRGPEMQERGMVIANINKAIDLMDAKGITLKDESWAKELGIQGNTSLKGWDTYTSEVASEIREKLFAIAGRAARGIYPTETENIYMSKAMNAFDLRGGVEPLDKTAADPGGITRLPDPKTGVPTTEKYRIENNQKQSEIIYYKNQGLQRMKDLDAEAAAAQGRPPRDWSALPPTPVEEARLQQVAQDWWIIKNPDQVKEQERLIKQGIDPFGFYKYPAREKKAPTAKVTWPGLAIKG